MQHNDDKLVQLTLEGDHDAFAALVEKYRSRVHTFAWRKIGWRIFIERVDERMRDEITYNLNSIFDYEFTPESHFFFLIADSLPGDRAVFAKLAYLFEPTLPNFARFN